MRGLHAGEEASLGTGGALLLRGEIVEFATREGQAVRALLLGEDADTAADSFSGSFVVARDDDNSDASLKSTRR